MFEIGSFTFSYDHIFYAVMYIINFIFASAVAKDAGQVAKNGEKTAMVSGLVWAFSTLILGIYVAAIYWFIHHSTLTRR